MSHQHYQCLSQAREKIGQSLRVIGRAYHFVDLAAEP